MKIFYTVIAIITIALIVTLFIFLKKKKKEDAANKQELAPTQTIETKHAAAVETPAPIVAQIAKNEEGQAIQKKVTPEMMTRITAAMIK